MSERVEEDHELMRRVAAGDPQAFRRLSDAHLATIVRFAHRMLGNRAEAEDVAQETFLRAWQRAKSYEPKARVSAWLHSIAKNLAIDRLRRRGTRGTHVEVDAERDAAPRSERPSELLGRKAKSQIVQAALDALPERQKMALLLWHEQGLSNPEIAAVLECSVEAVESLLSRGRRTLRAALESHLSRIPRAKDGQHD